MATRRSLLLGMGAAGLTLTACAGPRGSGRGPSMSARDPGSFSRGMELKSAGNIEGAVPYFAQVAGMGDGYEIAQYQLGDCFLQQALGETDPVKSQQKTREAAFWISLSAQSGDVNAQGRMAQLYFEGKGVPRDLAEAGKYVILAEANPRTNFVVSDISVGLVEIRAGLSPTDWEEAQHRADSFVPLKQTPRNFPAMPRQQRPSGGGRGGGGGRGRRLTDDTSVG